MKVLTARPHPAFQRTEAAVFGIYLFLTSWVAFHHEPWADEAQAWLLARDNSLGSLLFSRLHYEGTPGLWHTLLWTLCRFHLPYAAMQAVAVLLGATAVFVLLRWSPFPAVIRWLLPFSVAIAYQAPVVARSYSLIPLLAFSICAVLCAKKFHPLLFALLAGLLANTSLIGAFLASGIMLYYLVAREEPELKAARPRLQVATVFVLFGLFAIYTALPALDTDESQAQRLAANPRIATVIARLTGNAACLSGRCAAGFTVPQNGCQFMLQDVALRHSKTAGHDGAFLAFTRIVSRAFFPISSFNLLALAFYAALLVCQWRHRVLAASLPLLLALAGSKILPFSEHHMLVLWIAAVVSLWLTWNRISPDSTSRADLAFSAILLLVLVQQFAWTAFAARYTLSNPFDGSIAAARYLIAHAGGRTVVGFNYHSVGLQPYAQRNLYANQQATYWPWTCAADSDTRLPEALGRNPDFVIDGESYDGDVSWRNQILHEKPAWVRNDEDGVVSYLDAHGYHPTHRFCGAQPMHFGVSEETCEVIYEPSVSVATLSKP